jgi:hypothetical protein
MQQEVKPRDDARQDRQKPLSVLTIQEDALLGIALGSDVIERYENWIQS